MDLCVISSNKRGEKCLDSCSQCLSALRNEVFLYIHLCYSNGKNDVDHATVIQYYKREVSELRKAIDCYFVNSSTIEHAALDILAWLADQPENHELTCTRKEVTYGKGNG